MRIALVALVTLLIGGVVVGFVLYQNATPSDLPTAPGARAIGDFVSHEHMAASRASNHDDFAAKTPEDFRTQTGVWLGRQMDFDETLFGPESRLRFIGGRETHMPGPGRSAHALFVTEDGKWVSLFLQQYVGKPELDQNVSYSLSARGLGPNAPQVIVYRPGGQIHYLVSESQEGLTALQAPLNIPDPARRYR